MSSFLLDTNTVSYLIKGHSQEARRRMFEARVHGSVGLSAITVAELRFGLAKKQMSKAFLATMENFLQSVEVFPWASAEALTYGHLRASMQSQGIALSSMDLLIAAHAVSLDATLVTHDRAFSRISALKVVDWVPDGLTNPGRPS